MASDEDLGENPHEAMGSLREEVDEMLKVQVFLVDIAFKFLWRV